MGGEATQSAIFMEPLLIPATFDILLTYQLESDLSSTFSVSILHQRQFLVSKHPRLYCPPGTSPCSHGNWKGLALPPHSLRMLSSYPGDEDEVQCKGPR